MLVPDSDKLITMYYSGGAGGKFFSDLLALADNAVLMNKNLISLSRSGKLLECLNKYTNASLVDWYHVEYSDIDFYGHSYPMPNDIVQTLQKNNKHFFATVHGIKGLNDILKQWPKTKVVQLTNSWNFRDRCTKLKKYNSNKFSTYDEVTDYTRATIINVDRCFSDPIYMLENLQNVYDDLGLYPFYKQDILQVYDCYCKLHKIV